MRQRKLHDEELQKANPSANIIRAMKSKGMKCGICSKHGQAANK
jgi:hypothetical protein